VYTYLVSKKTLTHTNLNKTKHRNTYWDQYLQPKQTIKITDELKNTHRHEARKS